MFKKLMPMVGLLVVASMVLSACATPTPEVITIVETVEKVVEKEGETVTVIETVEKVVTATPEPAAPEQAVEFKSADPNTFYDIVGAGDTDTLDPAWNYESAGDAIILNVYEQLVTYDGADATSFVPALAEKWDISDDGTQYIFNIRQGVTFHDGADLTAEDVAYSLQRGVLQGGGWSPQWLYTEALFGTGTYDIAELVNPDCADDPECLQAEDPAALAEACQMVMDAFVADDAAGTVTMNLSQSWSPWLATLAQSWGSIIDKDWAIAKGAWDGDCATWQNFYGVTSENAPLRDDMNGTGPYMFDHWTPGEETVLVKNPNYWREAQNVPVFEGGPTGASADRVVIKLVGEWGTRFAMLQAGDADFVYVPRQNVAQVDPMVGELCEWSVADSAFSCAATENPDAPLRLFKGHPSTTRTDAMFVFDINVEGGNPYVGSGELDGNGIPPNFFSDVHVRRAFNYCFDWEAFIQDALAGEAVQNVGYLIPGMLGYENDGPMYSYDPDKCAEEMALAWDGQVAEVGFRMQVAYNTGNVTRQTIAEILQTNLSDIDPKYTVEIIGLPWPSFLAAIRGSRLPLYISGWAEDIHDPHNWAQPFLIGTYAARQALPEDMVAGFQELVNAGVSATDPAERAEIYQELTQMDYDNAIAIRLAVATGRHYEPRWVTGWYYNPIYGANSRYFTVGKE
ncbi:MAG: ABC transporter substrate-binding protein [Anaerolineae bacterium]